jgi:hypothetical protein
MVGQQMGARLAFNYDGTALQKELRAPYQTTYVVRTLSPLDYTKIMDPIKKFYFMINFRQNHLQVVKMPLSWLLYLLTKLLVLCSSLTVNVKRGIKSGAFISVQTHITDIDLNFRLMSDCVKSCDTNLILGLLVACNHNLVFK